MKLCLSRLEHAGLPVNQPYEQLATFIAEIDDKITQMRAEQEATSRSIIQDQRAATLAETDKANAQSAIKHYWAVIELTCLSV